MAILLSRRAERALAALDKIARRRILEGLSRLDLENVGDVKHLQGGGYRLRIGDFRVIFDRSGADVHVMSVGHRREVYR